jgi:hypothetical protein
MLIGKELFRLERALWADPNQFERAHRSMRLEAKQGPIWTFVIIVRATIWYRRPVL